MLEPFYYAACDSLLERSRMWIYGHTHEPKSTTLYGCKTVCSPLNTPGENPGMKVQCTTIPPAR